MTHMFHYITFVFTMNQRRDVYQDERTEHHGGIVRAFAATARGQLAAEVSNFESDPFWQKDFTFFYQVASDFWIVF